MVRQWCYSDLVAQQCHEVTRGGGSAVPGGHQGGGEAVSQVQQGAGEALEVERRKKDDDEKTVVVYQPMDVEVIDTSTFIKTNKEYGLLWGGCRFSRNCTH